MTEDQELLRLRCLELAVRVPGDPLPIARDFFAFVIGEDTKTSRQPIAATMEAADVR